MAYPTTTAASDVWSLRDVYKAEAGSNWPTIGGGAADPFIDNVSLLLNAESSPIQDATGQNTISVVGDVFIDTNVVKFGSGSLFFDRVGDELSIPFSSLFDFGSNNFTIESWINPTSSSEIVLSWGEDVSNRLDFGFYSNDLRFLIENSGIVERFTHPVDRSALAGSWHHIAVTREGNTFRLFLNGSQVTSGSYSEPAPTGNDSTVKIGVRSYSSSNAADRYEGNIDDLRVTKGVARYTQDFTPPSQAFPTS